MGIARSTALIPNGIAMGEISQHQPNPQPPMIKTTRNEPSFSTRATSLALVVLMLPLSARGYAQTTVTQSIPTGVSLTDSNGGITEVKPSEPIRPIMALETQIDNNATPEQASQSSQSGDKIAEAANYAWICTRDFYYRNKPQIESAAIALGVLLIGHEINAGGNTQPVAPTQQQSDR